MKAMQLKFALGFGALATSVGGLAQTVVHSLPSGESQATKPRMVLVELFTSEGCSSCPPADELLRRIEGKRTSDGTLIVGVSEHVSYWDHDGWKDPFDSTAITGRQDEYTDRFHLDSPYTPQMVVNGKVQFVGSDAKALVNAVGSTPTVQGATVQIVSAKVQGNSVVMVASVAGELPKDGAELFAVVAQDETTRNVTAGENRGRTLAHAAVARTYEKVASLHHAGQTTVTIALPDDLKTLPESRRHLITWAQGTSLGPVLGVDTLAF